MPSTGLRTHPSANGCASGGRTDVRTIGSCDAANPDICSASRSTSFGRRSGPASTALPATVVTKKSGARVLTLARTIALHRMQGPVGKTNAASIHDANDYIDKGLRRIAPSPTCVRRSAADARVPVSRIAMTPPAQVCTAAVHPSEAGVLDASRPSKNVGTRNQQMTASTAYQERTRAVKKSKTTEDTSSLTCVTLLLW